MKCMKEMVSPISTLCLKCLNAWWRRTFRHFIHTFNSDTSDFVRGAVSETEPQCLKPVNAPTFHKSRAIGPKDTPQQSRGYRQTGAQLGPCLSGRVGGHWHSAHNRMRNSTSAGTLRPHNTLSRTHITHITQVG